MWHIIKGALTQINMWYHQACMELWPVIQNSLNDIPVFQGDSYIYWLFLTPEQKCLTSLNFSADPCNRRSLMAAWKETHHPQAAAEVTQKNDIQYFMNWSCNVWGQRSVPPTQFHVTTVHHLFTVQQVWFQMDWFAPASPECAWTEDCRVSLLLFLYIEALREAFKKKIQSWLTRKNTVTSK